MTALLVDLDGTLVDTGEANWRAYAAALEEAGVRPTRAGFEARATGRHWRDFLPALLAGSGAAPEAVARRKAALYPAGFAHLRVNDALVALLAARPADWRAALVTTASAPNVAAVLAHTGLARLFDTIVTGDDVARPKPAPDGYALAAGRLGVVAGDCIVFEDSDVGAAAGRAFGAKVLRVSS